MVAGCWCANSRGPVRPDEQIDRGALRALYLDVAMGMAMVAFVATIVWARVVASPKPAPESQSEEKGS